MTLAALEPALFAVLPYVALMLFFLGTIQRYRAQKFTYSSLSSQFLENQHHFWALVPFHYGIITVLTGHLAAFLVPRQLLLWNRVPLRLYILEVAALACGLLTLIGLLGILLRRINDPKLRKVTTVADWAVYGLLSVSAFSGVYVAVFHPWGASWFATALTPYLWSLARFQPDAAALAGLPWAVKLHIVNAWLVIGFFPFSRLVHILVAPNPYLWRKPQVVRWYRPAPRRS